MKSQFKLHLALVIAGLALLFCLAPQANAQASSGGNYTVTQKVVAGGGASSTGGLYELLGTTAQHDAATSAGGIFTVEGGFWPGDDPFTSPPPPPPCAIDITAQITIVLGALELDPVKHHATQNVMLTYHGTNALRTQFALAIDNLTPGVIVYQPDGTTSCAAPKGSPYRDVGAGPQLSPGDVMALVVEFAYSGTVQTVNYTPRVLAGTSF